jgi:DNA gyrase/topoisomerase IV subunit A
MKRMNTTSSVYLENEYKSFSMYTLNSRAIVHASDGLKAAGRRNLWTARDGRKCKTATLAGETMKLHPHALSSGTINTLAAPYGNNIPLFTGYGAFGTLLHPTEFGADRYTSVEVSQFTKDVVFADIEIVPMTDNYDQTLQEPVHFLPLVPVALINPSEGTAVGFAANILPRALDDIIEAQIKHLRTPNKKIDPIFPYFTPTQQQATHWEESDVTGRIAYYFTGEYEKVNATTLRITGLPYGQDHQAVIKKLTLLEEAGHVTEFTDGSRDTYNIEVKFKKGVLSKWDEDTLLKRIGLTSKHTENLNVVNFSGNTVWATDPITLIREFTDWRLTWYVQRYERLLRLVEAELQRYYDIKLAIDNDAGTMSKKAKTRAALKEWLEQIGVVNLDYIADLPVYRFTVEEYKKNESRIKDAEDRRADYQRLLASEDDRKTVFISELTQVLKDYKTGKYTTKF